MKKLLLSPWTALLTLALVVGLRAADSSFVESVRLRYFDQLIMSAPKKDAGIHTVNIDEATLEKYGQYPFSRDIYANIVQELYRRNAGLVVFNILMPERDRFGKDSVLAKVMTEDAVILPNAGDVQSKNTARVPGSAVIGGDPTGLIVTYPGIIANTPELEAEAQGVGIVNTFPEIDGVVRRAPLIIASNGRLYPSLAMETLRVAAGDSTFQVKINENGVEKMRIPKFGPVVTDSLGRVWIDWAVTNRAHSAVDLPFDFNGAIVIVGVSARGIANPVATARGEVWPQDLQAAVLGTMIGKTNIERPDWADAGETIALALLGIILLLLTRWTYVGIIGGIVIIGGSIGGSLYLYATDHWLLDSTAIGAGLLLVMLHAYGVKFISEFLQKQQIKKQFGSYVNPTIVEKLQKNPELIKLGGERKELSIVMTDLRGFTSLGESFGDDVEGLTQIMNDYMTALSVPVLKNDGTLIKFIGDASLHVHGAPLDDPDHAYTAVITAQQMVQAIADFNVELQARGRPPVGMGAGVNTGETLIGNIGAKTKFGYDVLGDSVSTAARLEGQTKGYGVLLIIGPNTYEQVKDRIFALELDCIAVKGKTIGLNIYAPLTVHPGSHGEYEIGRREHEEMLKAYRRREFEHAIYLCDNLMGEFDGQMDHYYEIWKERCREMKLAKLGPDWDGIYRAQTK